ncbi:MAG: hypothetical protein H7Y31_12570 [Chitinophagaceae bacterium]|nr:hypothetical protein [Chitinophagaceae bacterium]
MKFIKLLSIVFFLVASISSCKKDNDNPPVTPASIEGVWVGKFGNGNAAPSSFFSFNFKANGVLEELTQTGEVKGVGTWDIENNLIDGYTINILAPVGNKYSVIGSYNASVKKILGNWGFGNSVTDGGMWEMAKK